MKEFMQMLMDEAIDNSWSAEADRKVYEEERVQPSMRHQYRRHTVRQRRRWNAKAKAYTMPKCGIRPVQLREMCAKKVPESDKLIVMSEKEAYHWRHVDRAYGLWSREEASRIRHPKAALDKAIDEFEFEQSALSDNEFEFDESFIFEGEKLSSLDSLNIFEELELPEDIDIWRELDELIDDGDLYFTPDGGLYIASVEAFNFICEHQDEILKIIS